MISETDYESEDSYVDGINDFINVYSSNENSRNNSYKSNGGEMLMKSNINLKKKEALNLLNEELKFKLYASKNIYYIYIFKQVLKELHWYFGEIKKNRLLYGIVLKEFKNRSIYCYGKMYKNFIDSL